MLACSPDNSTFPTTKPSSELAFELVNTGERLGSVNAHVYGSFAVDAGGGVIMSGPANFPGHPPKGPGTCDKGLWINAQGKRTSGTSTKPHPHCFSAAATIEVVLEPISACYSGKQDTGEEPPAEEQPPKTGAEAPAPEEPPKPGSGCPAVKATKGATTTQLLLRNLAFDENKRPLWEEASVTATDFDDDATPDFTVGQGTITAYAIDASTLGTTNHRVGTLRIDLSQYKSNDSAYIHLINTGGCDIDEHIESPCLNKVITARYNPLPVGGLGPVDADVEGFLWVTPANSPYNYTDMP
jgi:hypothetical protein